MGLIKQILGICETRRPSDPGCFDVKANSVEIDLTRAPELTDTSGALRIEGHGLRSRLLVYRDKSGEFHAIQNKCTHMGRRLDPKEQGLTCCSVNRSSYDHEGNVLKGPAKGPLKSFEIKMESNNKIVIKLAGK